MSEQVGETNREVWQGCYTCRDYATERREVIAEPLAAKARREGRDVVAIVDEFMAKAHGRHLVTGKPLREGGPSTVTNPLFGRILATYAMLGAQATSSTTAPTTPAETGGGQ